jgi:hypothetical protein
MGSKEGMRKIAVSVGNSAAARRSHGVIFGATWPRQQRVIGRTLRSGDAAR